MKGFVLSYVICRFLCSGQNLEAIHSHQEGVQIKVVVVDNDALLTACKSRNHTVYLMIIEIYS